MTTIQTRVDSARGCGWRKEGGLYLVSGGLSEPCPLLPHETTVCPTCGEGIRPARGFTWVDGAKFIPPTEHGGATHSMFCPLGIAHRRDGVDYGDVFEGATGHLYHSPPGDQMKTAEPVSRLGRCGLIWIGEQHYKSARSFMEEAARLGVSRRITGVPRDFVIGETWVLLGHRKALGRACPECGDDIEDADCPVCTGTGYVSVPGIVTAFRPTAIEYVVKGDETDDELEAIEARGITPVQVIRDEEQAALEVK